LDNYFRKLKNSSFFVRLDVERTHINQKIEIFENPTSAYQTIVRSFKLRPRRTSWAAAVVAARKLSDSIPQNACESSATQQLPYFVYELDSHHMQTGISKTANISMETTWPKTTQYTPKRRGPPGGVTKNGRLYDGIHLRVYR
jgi:hypothetical protein